MRILVTGASGPLGRAVVAEFDALGVEALTLRGRGDPAPGTRVASFRDPDALARAFDGVDAVLLVFPIEPDMARMAVDAVDAARRAGVRHLVRIGAIHGDAHAPYALLREHGRIDRIVVEGGVPWTLLHTAGLMQRWTTRLAAQVRAGTVASTEPDAGRPWVDVRDVAAAAATVLADPSPHAGRVHRITGPESLSVRAFAGIVGAAIGRPLRVERVTPEAALAALLAQGVPPERAALLASLARASADGLTAPVEPSTRRLILRPQIDARTFARDYAPVWGGEAARSCGGAQSRSNTMSLAPSHSTSTPIGRSCSRPSTIVRKWLPASGPIFDANEHEP